MSQEKKSDTQVIGKIVEFFTEDNWDFSTVENKSLLRMSFRGKHGQWTCYAQAREAQKHFVFYSVAPFNVPENQLWLMAEFIARVNYGLIVGNFELDFADGQIRYKTSIDLEGTQLNSVLIKQLVYTNVLMMDKYLPGIMKVIHSDVSPAEAIAQIEGEPE